MLVCIANFVDDEVSGMNRNISDLTRQMSVLNEETVEYWQNATTQISGLQQNVHDMNTKTEQTSYEINEMTETTANHTTHIADLEQNLATCLQTSVEQSNVIHQMQQNLQIIQERLDTLNHTLIQDIPRGESYINA